MDAILEILHDVRERYLGRFNWEARLSDKDTHRLAVTRSLMTPEDEEAFALEFADIMESSEFNSALEETEGDPNARTWLEAELDAYPYEPIWDNGPARVVLGRQLMVRLETL